MLKRLVVLVALMALAIASGACAMFADDTIGGGGGVKTTAFESWAVGNGTGAFFKAVGPAGGTGVRHAWPE